MIFGWTEHLFWLSLNKNRTFHNSTAVFIARPFYWYMQFSVQMIFIVSTHCIFYTFFIQLKPQGQAANLISVQHLIQNWIKSVQYLKEMLQKKRQEIAEKAKSEQKN